MLFTAMGQEIIDWTVNDAWPKKATYAYMRYLVGDFDMGPEALAPRTRSLGSRLEVRTGKGGNVRVTDTRGRLVASGQGSAAERFDLKPGVYFVSVKTAGRLSSKTVVIP